MLKRVSLIVVLLALLWAEPVTRNLNFSAWEMRLGTATLYLMLVAMFVIWLDTIIRGCRKSSNPPTE